jgi:transposase
MMKIKRRRRISDKERELIISSYEEQKDWKQVSSVLGIKINTAYKIIANSIKFGQRSRIIYDGPRNQKVDEQMNSFIIETVQENADVTLREIKQLMEQQMPDKPKVTLKTISNVLDGALYTSKKLYVCPFNRNDKRVVDERKAYAEWFVSMQENANQNLETIFIDECGWDLWTKRDRGRSIRGTKAVVLRSGWKGSRQEFLLNEV